MKPLVALVGRPNVGKSTLFNRLVGRRAALVKDAPGVTRDRHYGDAEWNDRIVTLIDTGGFVLGDKDELLSAVRAQAELAIGECDAVLLLVDGQVGPTPVDESLAGFLRKVGKPLILVVNKLDNARTEEALAADFYRLGLGVPFAISAEHSRGLDALLEHLLEQLPDAPAPESSEPAPATDAVRLAIVGRPNVGKSTLVNALLRQERLVASNVPGTTRDPIDSELQYQGRTFILTDTAGIRRQRSYREGLEQVAVLAALKAIDRSDVVVLLLDAQEPAVEQDAKIAGIAEEKGRALLLVVNKWDKVPDEKRDQDAFREELKYQLKFVAYVPILFTSALKGQKVDKVLELAAMLYEQFHFRAPTPRLNRLLQHITDEHPAPLARGKPLRLYYIAQVGSAPPTFALTCNYPSEIPEAYKRYIINQIRKTFDLRVPLHLVFRERPGRVKRVARKKPGKRRRTH